MNPTPHAPQDPNTPHVGDPASIRRMFGEIAGRYDLANSVLSGGIHKTWKRALVAWSGARVGDRVLDCATGTGDLAFLFEERVGRDGQVVATDFCEPMLDLASAKAKAAESRTQFEVADMNSLPYPDESFAVASVSFGIRNVPEPARALAELARVVRPGGTVMVLEFGQPVWRPFRGVYNFYSKRFLPVIGGVLSGKREAYRYLQTSSETFPCGRNFEELALATGKFAVSESRPLTGGIAYLYRLTVGKNEDA